MAQFVASMSGVVLGGVVMVVGSNLARGKILTAPIGSVDSLYHSVSSTARLVPSLFNQCKYQYAHTVRTRKLTNRTIRQHVF